jgi:glycosyltransferase involved in cell wall biosynthesis
MNPAEGLFMTTGKSQPSQPLNPRQVWATRRLWLKERIFELGLDESRFLQSIYASSAEFRANLALRRSHPYEAASRILQVWRHIGTKRIGHRRIARFLQIVQEHCYRDGQLLPAAENRLRLDFIRSAKAIELRKHYGSLPMEHRVRLRLPRPDPDPERQGDLIILKPYDPATGERGVLMVMYNEGMLAMAAVFDLGQLASRYMFVLEPSWWGYQDAVFFLYLGIDLQTLVQAQRRPDFEFIESVKTNLVPVRVGAGEWVDPATFHPREQGREATYDVVMIAAWDPYKRHEVFFRAAANLKEERGLALRIALIGYPIGWTRETIEGLLRRYGLEDSATIFEQIPHDEVARIVADSKMSLLLSRREGANRAIYESMFCGTPIIVYRHNCGSNLDHVNQQTGLLADDDELASSIAYVLGHTEAFSPRSWALENVGYLNATAKVNEALREVALSHGSAWTQDIAARKNAPNLRYAQPGLYKTFEDEYQRLQAHLLPLE